MIFLQKNIFMNGTLLLQQVTDICANFLQVVIFKNLITFPYVKIVVNCIYLVSKSNLRQINLDLHLKNFYLIK